MVSAAKEPLSFANGRPVRPLSRRVRYSVGVLYEGAGPNRRSTRTINDLGDSSGKPGNLPVLLDHIDGQLVVQHLRLLRQLKVTKDALPRLRRKRLDLGLGPSRLKRDTRIGSTNRLDDL